MKVETVKYWVRKFKSGFLSIHDSTREGRPNFVTEDSVCQVKTLVLEDRRVTVKQFAAITKMSVGSIETILHDHLHMSKVSARWVPRLLTPNHDNAPAHRSMKAVHTSKIHTFKILPHMPYSKDLAPSDFFLFPSLKKKTPEGTAFL